MATEQQVQQMLDLMQQQMTAFHTLQAENTRLREEGVVAANNNIPNNIHNNNNANNNNVNNNNRYKAKKPDRPIINAALDDREWALFMDTWARYKTMINVVEVASVRMELRAACSDDVNKLLFEFVGAGTLDGCTEEELLGHIKSVAVKSVHKEVHQVAFNKILQNSGESVTNYVARLKAKAFLCEFEVSCTDHNPVIRISYAEQMVSQRLLAGLSNQEHQRKILAEAPTLITLYDKVKRLQILETTEESVSILKKNCHLRKQQFNDQVRKAGTLGAKDGVTGKCKLCWRSSHPGGKVMDRVK